jgi:hypothetical protein
MNRWWLTLALAALVTAGDRGTAQNANALTLRDFVIEPPTLINLGFEWFVDGDANRNAAVTVSYRREGTSAWREALPLMRLQGERIAQGRQLDVTSPNMFAGSVLDLEPDTTYEVRFQVSDPDGVTGERTRVVRTRTRAEPKAATDGRTFHVYPPNFKGAKIEPSFEGLMCAYNLTCAGTDWATAGRPRVRPGDIILVHAGLYKYNRLEYTNNAAVNRTVPLDGTYYLTADGTPERPIVIKGAGDGEVIFDGAGNFALFDVKAADYNYFEGITFRNSDIAIWAGTQFAIGSKGLTVKHSRFENVAAGIFTNYSGSSNFYIADNWFFGRNDPDHVIGWAGNFWQPFDGVEGQKFPPVMASYVAVKLYGPGHVIAYNYVANFHDGVNIETYGNPDGSAAEGGPAYPPKAYWDRRPVAIDFYNNLMTNFHDNPFETDGGLHNIRVMRNLMLNSASHAFCNQPVIGGPAYWIRNVAYHLPGGSTRLTGGSAGVLFYNNTILSETAAQGASNVHWRNNLILGQNSSPAIFSINTYTNYSSSDYNGFRPNPGAAVSFQWNSPPSTVAADYSALTAGPRGGGPGGPTAADGRGGVSGAGRGGVPEAGGGAAASGRGGAAAAGRGGATGGASAIESRAFATLAEYSAATKQDQHSVLLDYDVFVKVPRLDAQDRSRVQTVYKAADLDFTLRAGSAAVDRGIKLPTVTEGFAGSAPDLGALEVGQPAPHYGPRR